jgi:hypothetical protein
MRRLGAMPPSSSGQAARNCSSINRCARSGCSSQVKQLSRWFDGGEDADQSSLDTIHPSDFTGDLFLALVAPEAW